MPSRIRWARVSQIVAIVAIVISACTALTACGSSGAGSSSNKEALTGTITFWWWGQEEAPGLQTWLEKTAAAFEQKYPGRHVKLVQQTNENIVQSSQASQAAQKGPDLQWYWPVGWYQEDIFNGGLTPLNELVGEEEIAHYPEAARNYATWKGKVYGAPMFSIGNPWVYRKDLFKKAGLDPNRPPKTMAELVTDSKALNAAGITPIAAGMKDQFYAEWPFMLMQACGVKNTSEWFNAFLGHTSLEAPAFEQTWKKIQTTQKEGMYGKNLFDVTLYEGFDELLKGNAAMATPTAPDIPRWERKLGSSKLGVFLTPCQNESPLAAKYPNAWHYVGIPSFSHHKKEAASFINFMHEPQNADALYQDANAEMGDERLSITPPGPASKQIFEWSRNDSYFALLYTSPPSADEWILPNVSKLLQGSITPKAAAAFAQRTNKRWLERSPRLANDFAQWETQVTKNSK